MHTGFPDQKTERAEIFQTQYKAEENAILKHIFTSNEIWVYHYNAEIKQLHIERCSK